ncbi:MAG: LTA synthase family protein, partial [Solobacterium sp.]|nr:LTA synthase family protein [Solobacterium sp.]
MFTKQKRYVRIIGILLSIALLCLGSQYADGCLARENFGQGLLALTGLAGVCIFFLSWWKINLPPKKWVQKLAGLFCIALSSLACFAAVEILNTNLITEINYAGNAALNYLCFVIFHIAVYGITANVGVTVGIMDIASFLFGMVSMYCKKYKGSPLLPWDFLSIRTAANVAGSFTYEIDYTVVFAAMILVCMILLATWLPKTKRDRLTTAAQVSSLLFFGAVFHIFYNTGFVHEVLAAAPDFFNQTRGYESNGAIAEFMLNTRYLSLRAPKGYSAEGLQEDIYAILDNEEISTITETALNQKPGDPGETPDIIVIMNESYSDLSVCGEFETNIPYMRFVNELRDRENVIEGNAYVSTIGTGTSNTEFEFLTGNSMGFLPSGSNAYQLYVDHEQPSLVSTLKDQDFSAIAFHPYYSSSWNRPAVYEFMGFEDFITQERLYNKQIIRRFISDAYDFNYIRKKYEARDEEKPFFVFNITMQNHSSYEQVYDSYEQEVWVTSCEKEYPQTNQYLSLIKTTDDAFEDLVNYFMKAKRPVILLMFGDHQPFIEGGFYQEVMGESLSRMSDETAQKRFITRFIMCANYDIPE